MVSVRPARRAISIAVWVDGHERGVARPVGGQDSGVGEPVHGRDERRTAMLREGEGEPVEVTVNEVELAGPRQGVRDVHGLGDPAVRRGIVGVSLRAYAVEPSRGNRIQGRKQCHVDPCSHQPVREQTRDLFPWPVGARRSSPRNGPQESDFHAESASAS